VEYGAERGLPATVPQRVTPLEYYQASQDLVQEFLDGTPEVADALGDVLAAEGSAVVRIESFQRIESTTGRDLHHGGQGSGVVLGSGPFVLTAAHVVEPAAGLQITVLTTSGERHAADVVARGAEQERGAPDDWALLRLRAPWATAPLAPTVGRVRTGDHVVAFGYPGGIFGFGADGRVTGHIDSPPNTASPLLPLVWIGRVGAVDPLVVAPCAGLFPEGGMSGGPLFDRNGGLVGLISRTPQEITTQGIWFAVECASVRAALARAAMEAKPDAR